MFVPIENFLYGDFFYLWANRKNITKVNENLRKKTG